jgi:methyltransferase (TIGR00027 family)
MTSLGSARSDGDSWDVLSSVGATATIVAAGRAMASKGPRPLLDDPFAEPLVRAVGHDFFTQLMDEEISLEHPDSPMTQLQRCEQMAVRTRFFDDFLLRATAGGVRQVVILASGLDARAYRLPWPTGTVVFEIDQPEVIEFKTRTLAGIGARPTADRRAVGVDLRDDWVGALREAFFSPSAPTAWIAEGLLIYLPPGAQDRLLDLITEVSSAGSSFATEHFESLEMMSGQNAKVWRSRWRKLGLDLDVGDLVWDGDRNPPGDYLRAAGWSTTLHRTEDLYASHGFEMPDENVAPHLGKGYLTAQRGAASTSQAPARQT